MPTPEPATFNRRTAELRHTLRTPINHMIGYAELLLEDSQRPQESEPCLTTILGCAQQVLTLVQRHLQSGDSDTAGAEIEVLQVQSRSALHEALEATEVLSRIETGRRIEDVERIRFAVEELVRLRNGFSPDESACAPAGSFRKCGNYRLRLWRISLLWTTPKSAGRCCAGCSSGEGISALLSKARWKRWSVCGPQHFDMVLLDFMMPGLPEWRC